MNHDTNREGRDETRPEAAASTDAGHAWPRGDALDALLARDEVVAPDGLAERIAVGVGAERRARSRRSLPTRWPLRVVAPVSGLAAAAALALYVALPEGDPGGDPGATAEGLGPEPPSDELLAALPELEAWAFMADELEPLEEDALFLLEPTDELVLELLEEE